VVRDNKGPFLRARRMGADNLRSQLSPPQIATATGQLSDLKKKLAEDVI